MLCTFSKPAFQRKTCLTKCSGSTWDEVQWQHLHFIFLGFQVEGYTRSLVKRLFSKGQPTGNTPLLVYIMLYHFYLLFLVSLSSKHPLFLIQFQKLLNSPFLHDRGVQSRDSCGCYCIFLIIVGMYVNGAAHVQSVGEWQDGPSEHTIDWDDWIEAWLKVQQDHLKRLSVWTGIMRRGDQTLCYRGPICTARYFRTLHKPSFLHTFFKRSSVWVTVKERE